MGCELVSPQVSRKPRRARFGSPGFVLRFPLPCASVPPVSALGIPHFCVSVPLPPGSAPSVSASNPRGSEARASVPRGELTHARVNSPTRVRCAVRRFPPAVRRFPPQPLAALRRKRPFYQVGGPQGVSRFPGGFEMRASIPPGRLPASRFPGGNSRTHASFPLALACVDSPVPCRR